MVWGGTGANNVALASMLGPAQAVVCTEGSHINVDETGAPERILGAKLIDVPTEDGKLRPEQVEALAHAHRRRAPRPARRRLDHAVDRARHAVLARRDRRPRRRRPRPRDDAPHGRRPHRQRGASRSGRDVRSFTGDVGVDVISFGGTKNGMMYGEAVVYLDAALGPFGPLPAQAGDAAARRRCGSSPRSSRPCSTDDLWLRSAAHANAMAARLHGRVHDVAGRRARRAACGQQPLPAPAQGRHRAAAGVELLLRLGPGRAAGALDDQLRHDRGGRRALRRRRAGGARLRRRTVPSARRAVGRPGRHR